MDVIPKQNPNITTTKLTRYAIEADDFKLMMQAVQSLIKQFKTAEEFTGFSLNTIKHLAEEKAKWERVWHKYFHDFNKLF